MLFLLLLRIIPGNQVTSNAVSVSVGEEVGLVPKVELKSVQSPLTYSDSPITVKLHAGSL